MFPSPSPLLHPSPGATFCERISADRRTPPTPPAFLSILSFFISLCLYRPLSLLLHSLHRGESTHLPSCRATPLPSIRPYSPPGGDRSYQRPPSSLSSVSSIQLSLHLYLCSCDILSFSLSTFVFFSGLQSLISISLLHFKEIAYGPARRKPTLKCITLKREHEVNNLY